MIIAMLNTFNPFSFILGYIAAALTVPLAAWLLARARAMSGLEHYGCLRKPSCGRAWPRWRARKEAACLTSVNLPECFWCPETRLIQEILPEYEGKPYEYYVCPDCGTGYIFTDSPIVFVMPAWEISASKLWQLEQQYKRRISKPGSSGKAGKRRKIKKAGRPITTERFRLE